MRTFLALAILLSFTSAALAQDNKIVVINEDGTVTSVDMDAPPSVLRQGKPAATPPSPAAEARSTVKPAKKPAAQKQAVKKETPVKKAAAPKKKKTKPQVNQKQAAPSKPAPAPAYVSPRPQRLGPQMTPEDAIRIALDVAPPARTVNAYPVNYKGLHAYEVVFATENGNRFVYVDRETGRLVK